MNYNFKIKIHRTTRNCIKIRLTKIRQVNYPTFKYSSKVNFLILTAKVFNFIEQFKYANLYFVAFVIVFFTRSAYLCGVT